MMVDFAWYEMLVEWVLIEGLGRHLLGSGRGSQ